MNTRSAAELSWEAAILSRIAHLARRVARKFHLDEDDLDDLAQDIVLEFLGIFGDERRCVIGGRLPGLVRRMVLRRIGKTARGKQRRAGRDSDFASTLTGHVRGWMSPDVGYDERLLAELYETTLASLSPQRQRVFLMVREEGRTYRSVANALGISRATVQKHVVRAQARFRKALLEHHIELLPQTTEVQEHHSETFDASSPVLQLTSRNGRSDATARASEQSRRRDGISQRRGDAAA